MDLTFVMFVLTTISIIAVIGGGLRVYWAFDKRAKERDEGKDGQLDLVRVNVGIAILIVGLLGAKFCGDKFMDLQSGQKSSPTTSN